MFFKIHLRENRKERKRKEFTSSTFIRERETDRQTDRQREKAKAKLKKPYQQLQLVADEVKTHSSLMK